VQRYNLFSIQQNIFKKSTKIFTSVRRSVLKINILCFSGLFKYKINVDLFLDGRIMAFFLITNFNFTEFITKSKTIL